MEINRLEGFAERSQYFSEAADNSPKLMSKNSMPVTEAVSSVTTNKLIRIILAN